MPHIAVHELVKNSFFSLDNCRLGFRLLVHVLCKPWVRVQAFEFLGCCIWCFSIEAGCHRKFSKFLLIAGRSLQG